MGKAEQLGLIFYFLTINGDSLLKKVKISTELEMGLETEKALRDRYIYFRDKYFHFIDRFCPSLIVQRLGNYRRHQIRL
jgi:hypothetical protein